MITRNIRGATGSKVEPELTGTRPAQVCSILSEQAPLTRRELSLRRFSRLVAAKKGPPLQIPLRRARRAPLRGNLRVGGILPAPH